MVRGGCRGQWLLRDRGMSANDTARRMHARLALTGLAFRARRAAELRTVAAREMRRRLEAAGGGGIGDRPRGLQQQLARAAPAPLQVVAVWDAGPVDWENGR